MTYSNIIIVQNKKVCITENKNVVCKKYPSSGTRADRRLCTIQPRFQQKSNRKPDVSDATVDFSFSVSPRTIKTISKSKNKLVFFCFFCLLVCFFNLNIFLWLWLQKSEKYNFSNSDEPPTSNLTKLHRFVKYAIYSISLTRFSSSLSLVYYLHSLSPLYLFHCLSLSLV